MTFDNSYNSGLTGVEPINPTVSDREAIVVSIWMAPNGTKRLGGMMVSRKKGRICYVFGATRRIRTDDLLITNRWPSRTLVTHGDTAFPAVPISA